MTDLPIAPDAAPGLTRTAGVVVEFESRLYFVPARVAERIVAKPVVSRVPGSEFGIALVNGRVTSVIDVAEGGNDLLVCDIEGEALALSGLKVYGCGFYPSRGNGIALGDELVPELEVTALIHRRRARER
jgi:hypothetical protein